MKHKDLTITFLGLAGFATGMGIVLWDAKATQESQDFTNSPEFLVWLFLIGAQFALWFALVAPLVELLRTLEFDRKILTKCALYLLGLLPLFMRCGYGRSGVHPLAGQALKMSLINFIGLATATLAIFGIWLVQAALDRMRSEAGFAEKPENDVANFLVLQSKLERFLLAAGIIIGAATLATGGLRNSILAFDETAKFPPEYVLLYGMFYSGLLALIYGPAYASLLAVRSHLHDALVPIPQTPPDSWSGWHSNRQAVGELLKVQSGPIASFTNGVSILTPLIGSLAAILLGG